MAVDVSEITIGCTDYQLGTLLAKLGKFTKKILGVRESIFLCLEHIHCSTLQCRMFRSLRLQRVFLWRQFLCVYCSSFAWRKNRILAHWRCTMGLIGVLVVIQPGYDGFKPVLFLPVCAGAFYALAVIITRGFCNEETSFSLMIIHNFFYAMLGSILVSFLTISPFDPNTVISNPFLLTGWVENTKTLLFLIGLTSLTHILAMSSSIIAYQNSEASFLAPLEYSYLIFAAFIDLVIWDFVPSGSQILVPCYRYFRCYHSMAGVEQK